VPNDRAAIAWSVEINEATPPMMRVRDWDRPYENDRSRGMKNTHWFPMPNDLRAASRPKICG